MTSPHTEAAAKALRREVYIYHPPDRPEYADARHRRYCEIAELMLSAADKAACRERQGELFGGGRHA